MNQTKHVLVRRNGMIYFVMVYIIAMFMISCNKQEANAPTTDPKVQINPLENSDLTKVARVVSEMGLNLDMVKDMKKGIEQSIQNGRDEEITFREILSKAKDDNGTMRSSGDGINAFASKFANKVRDGIPAVGLRSVTAEDFLQKIQLDGMNLY